MREWKRMTKKMSARFTWIIIILFILCYAKRPHDVDSSRLHVCVAVCECLSSSLSMHSRHSHFIQNTAFLYFDHDRNAHTGWFRAHRKLSEPIPDLRFKYWCSYSFFLLPPLLLSALHQSQATERQALVKLSETKEHMNLYHRQTDLSQMGFQ